MKYYIAENGQPAGPFELKDLMQHGLTPNSQVWNEKMSGWTRASEVPELMTLMGLPVAAQPVQPVQPVQPQPSPYAPQQPQPEQPQQPVYEQPQQPVYSQPQQPVYEQPQQPVYETPQQAVQPENIPQPQTSPVQTESAEEEQVPGQIDLTDFMKDWEAKK